MPHVTPTQVGRKVRSDPARLALPLLGRPLGSDAWPISGFAQSGHGHRALVAEIGKQREVGEIGVQGG